MRLSRVVVCLVAFWVLLIGIRTVAQSINATITGTVVDSKGGGVAGAVVTITSEEKGIVVRTVNSDQNGQFSVPLLPAGNYSVTVEANGFKKIQQTHIALHANDNRGLSFALELGANTETVTVQSDLLQIDTQSATSEGLISPREMREIPLSTRNYEQLVALMPGVSSNSADQIYLGTTNPVGGTNTVSFAIQGGRNSGNSWTVDGADNVDRGSNLTLLTYPSVDAIAEFKVLRGQYDAEFGRAAGGQINVITKTGGRNFHGDAYEFFRNDKLNANNFFNNANNIKRPPLRYNDFGYTIGGPLFIPNVYNTNRDKTFFFFSEEFRRVIVYGTVTATVPTPDMIAGNFAHNVCTSHDVNGACTATGNTITNIDPLAQAYLQDIYSTIPAPNGGASQPFTLTSALESVFNARQELVRVDHVFNPKLTVSVRYIHDSIPTIEPGGLFTGSALPGVAATQTNSPGYSWLARANSTFSPTFLNEGGFIFSYGAIISDPIGSIGTAASPDIHPTLPYTSTLNRVPGLVFGGGGTSVTGYGPYRDYNRNYNVFDTVTKIMGRHTWKVGFVYNRYQKNENAGLLNAGQFSFTSAPPAGGATAFEEGFADFLTGFASQFTQAQYDLSPDMRQHEFDIFGQDQIRVRKNLTVSLGVRYSRYGQPYDKNGFLTSFDPSSYDPAKAPALLANGNICLTGTCANGTLPNPNYDPLNGIIIGGQNSPFGDKVSNEDNKNFAPRIGIAWDPLGKGRTSVRAGYGIFYDSTLVGTYEQNIFANPPFAPNVLINNTSFDDPASGVPTLAAAPLALRATPVPGHTPYSQQWSLDVQHQLTSSFLIDVGYFGTNGVHLLGIVDINQVQPGAGFDAGLTAPGLTYFTSATTGPLNALRPYVGYNAINTVENEFNSNYNALQVAVKKRWGAGSLLNVYYTYSHNLTNNQSDRSTAAQNVYDIDAEYGPTQFDKRHILTADYVYELPFFRQQSGAVGRVLGGWQAAGIVSFSSGAPLTPTESTYDPAGLGFLGASAAGGRPNQIGSAQNGAPHTVAQFFNTSAFVIAGLNDPTVAPGTAGRGSIIGPGIQRWDLAAVKNIKIHEDVSLQFRGELFNAFNHTNFNAVGVAITTPSTFGKVTSAHDARIVQLGLKLYF